MTTINNIKTTLESVYTKPSTANYGKDKVAGEMVEHTIDKDITQVSLSVSIEMSSAPFDSQKVQDIKAQLATGTFVMDSSKIADKILESLIK